MISISMLRYLLFAFGVSVLWGFSTSATAASPNIVISHIQTGGSGTGTSGQEFVGVYNNLATPVDVTDWCLKYADYNASSISELFCFEKAADMDSVLLPARGTAIVVSQAYPVTDLITITGKYKSSTTAMSGTRGHVFLYDHENNFVDRVAWDNGGSSAPINPEIKAATAPIGGNMILREYDNGTYIDTDNNYDDFVSVISTLPEASILIDYKEPPQQADVCTNIAGVQTELPTDYGYDERNDCYSNSIDVCSNISLIQLTIPESMMLYEGACYDTGLDVCPNVDGFQLSLPDAYRIVGASCKQITDKKNLMLTELLANAVGTDDGNEFIEVYNNDTDTIDLSDYVLYVGKNAEKQIALPARLMMPGQYTELTAGELGFTLLNTTTRVEIHFYDGSLVSEIIPYQDPADGLSWALIDSVWQYTNSPTPGTANVASTEEVLGEQTNTEKGIQPCPSGKYRNPLTNRCRNIEEDASVLATCDADEYRNPDTNRCRKISLASAALADCEDGYERNPATNRCRKISADSNELTPCQDGYERNPATNRCKKTVEAFSAVADVAKNLEQNNASSPLFNSPYAIAATAGVGAVGFGIYEWRTELGIAIRRILGIFNKK